MKADLLLSRPSYQAGTPVVGTVRIRRAETKDTQDGVPSSSAADDDDSKRGPQHHQQQKPPLPIRQEIVSARLYLAGRAHLGSNARGKVSRWRSNQEVNQLKKIYGEHACLTMAKMDEVSCWSKWNDVDSNDDGNSSAVDNTRDEAPTNASFCKHIDPPKVTHIEQAERVAVQSSLHHSAKTNQQLYDNNNPQTKDYSHLPTPHENNTICFWMTNVLELLHIPERHLDRCTCAVGEGCQQCRCRLRPGRGKLHGDMNPYRRLQLPDLDVVRDVLRDKRGASSGMRRKENGECKLGQEDTMQQLSEKCGVSDSSSSNIDTPVSTAWDRIAASAKHGNRTLSESTTSNIPLEQIQVAVTFRANLPIDVPPTMSAECVKYFYSAVLAVTTTDGEVHVTQCTFTVHTSNSQHTSHHQLHQPSSTRVHIGDLHAIAHSVALPTYVSSTEASDATPSQLTVVSNPPACDIVSRHTSEQRTSTHRIQDERGCFCGLMTLVGVGGPLVPGTRLGVRVQFPLFGDDDIANGADVIPCHRVCCALVGDEYAVFEGSSTSSTTGSDNVPMMGKKRVKTRSYVFDSAYELMEFGYTEAVSMGLVLPLDCPVTVKTDLVEVIVNLKVEFTVSSHVIASDEVVGSSEREFNTIRMDLPCEVIHCSEEDRAEDEGEGEIVVPSSAIRIMQQFWKSDNNPRTKSDEGFDDTDIRTDLKHLSLRIIDL